MICSLSQQQTLARRVLEGTELWAVDGKMKHGGREEEGRRGKEDENKVGIFDKLTNF